MLKATEELAKRPGERGLSTSTLMFMKTVALLFSIFFLPFSLWQVSAAQIGVHARRNPQPFAAVARRCERRTGRVHLRESRPGVTASRRHSQLRLILWMSC